MEQIVAHFGDRHPIVFALTDVNENDYSKAYGIDGEHPSLSLNMQACLTSTTIVVVQSRSLFASIRFCDHAHSNRCLTSSVRMHRMHCSRIRAHAQIRNQARRQARQHQTRALKLKSFEGFV
jgi:hypothetical protein